MILSLAVHLFSSEHFLWYGIANGLHISKPFPPDFLTIFHVIRKSIA